MARIRSDRLSLGQATAARTIELVSTLCQQGTAVTVRWVLGHGGVESNEAA